VPAAIALDSRAPMPHPWAPANVAADRAVPSLQAGGRAFLGLPAGRSNVDKQWLSPVIRSLLDKHDRVLVLIESELISYERCANLRSTEPILRPTAVSELITVDTMERWHELDVIRHALPPRMLPRVQIASWTHFIDHSFATLWRHLLTAFAVSSSFRQDVLAMGRDAMQGADGAAEQAARTACLCHVEALAMRLRVAEIAAYHNEYGPLPEDVLSARLYAGDYTGDGLTVESLVGHPARRRYHQL